MTQQAENGSITENNSEVFSKKLRKYLQNEFRDFFREKIYCLTTKKTLSMANTQIIKLAKYKFKNNFLEGTPIMYLVRIKSQNVITGNKLVKNIADHAALPTPTTEAILNALYDAVNDYLAAGHPVQIDNLCTVKPKVKSKAKEDISKVNAKRYTQKLVDGELVENDGCIKSVTLQVWPIGDTKTMINEFKFAVESGVTEAESGEIGGDEGGEEQGGGEGSQVILYNLVFKHNDSVVETRQFAEGETVTAPTAPEGYVWTELPTTMPARDLVVTTIAEGGDTGEI